MHRHDFLEVPVGALWCEETLSSQALREAGEVINRLCERITTIGEEHTIDQVRDAVPRLTKMEWYNDACLFVLISALIHQPWILENTDVRVWYPLWNGATVKTAMCPIYPARQRRDQPLHLPLGRLLGEDSRWRERISVMAFQPSAFHFATIVIIGPRRMVVVYDSLSSETPGTALNYRLRLEEETGAVSAEDNDNWMALPHNKHDQNSCGPLSVSCALLLAQGYVPSATSMRLGAETNGTTTAQLRTSHLLDLIGMLYHMSFPAVDTLQSDQDKEPSSEPTDAAHDPILRRLIQQAIERTAHLRDVGEQPDSYEMP
ncbi:hypothetical protein A1Q1_07573 [Trichosporon asahii var. asahii CBS 2479]|uniref:Ubiquitin-like protease family profile domain-containing protein n=1 Tax=Trichosporon asahii var. asahii (strain ATCC 90039 / CBS 2479 / JCM 2466 / KCTC 7840 / NBRC 103889/ NCYC 2677 / UAMH 7654) TaxID=1186058 RepID=J5TJG5_TRIAS|nr:hypothetical protein A1Q1_07573 [Trichosporon asahii var. asahii CBS 2479]EJT51216.1 hypothetical protein A1Q1_07573 [Trichosporon asahii var. asahii CBS 2479]